MSAEIRFISFLSPPVRSAVIAGTLFLCLAGASFGKLCRDYIIYSELNPAPLIGEISFTAPVLDVSVYAGHAYLAAGNDGLRIVELSNIEIPLAVGQLFLGAGEASVVAAHGCHAFVAVGARIHTVDITSAPHPFPVGGTGLTADVLDIEIEDDLLTAVLADSSLVFFPTPACDPPGQGTVLSVGHDVVDAAVSGARVFVAGAAGITEIDIQDPAAPVMLGSVPDLPPTVAVAVLGDTLTAVTIDELLVLDLASPGLPVLLDRQPLPGPPAGLLATGREIYVPMTDENWWVYSTDHQQLREPRGPGWLPSAAEGWDLTGTWVFFATGDTGLQIFWQQCKLAEPTSVELSPATGGFGLTVYPNPGNPAFTIAFTLDRPGWIDLSCVNLAGRRVAALEAGHRDAGSHRVKWNGRDDHGRSLPSGIYRVILNTADGATGTSLVLLR